LISSTMQRLLPIASVIEKSINSILHTTGNMVYWEKKDQTFVTNIDIMIQSAIIREIRQKYHADNIISEEQDRLYTEGTGPYTWIIDPIDGTHNFISGKNEYGVSIGLMKGNEFIEALLIFPALKETYYAAKNKGVWKNETVFEPPVSISEQNNREMILCSKTFDRLGGLLEASGYKVSCYRCATYSLLMLLKRKACIYHTINTMIYDVGPMAFIIKESGAKCFDNKLDDLVFNNNDSPIPFFLASVHSTLPDSICDILISN
jgi:fructose-1,6-bisphosphatase/inositol monophosphatase family enzyme